jgi:hypothetical protein
MARFEGKASELSFESTITLQHSPELALDQPSAGRLNAYPFAYPLGDLPDVHSSMLRVYPDAAKGVASWSKQFLRDLPRVDAIHVLTAMTHAIHRDFEYVQRAWGPPQSPTETLKRHAGTCRDFAVLMMEAARALGLATRFVSGYLFVPTRPGEPERRGGGNTHAWVRVFLPSGGWIEFDPTNGLVGSQDLIRVAVVREPHQAVTLAGSWEGSASDYLGMEVRVDVDTVQAPTHA